MISFCPLYDSFKTEIRFLSLLYRDKYTGISMKLSIKKLYTSLLKHLIWVHFFSGMLRENEQTKSQTATSQEVSEYCCLSSFHESTVKQLKIKANDRH